MIYLDNAATTRIAPEVLEAMMPYLTDQYGNAGTIYSFGRQAATAVQTARSQVARLFGCTPEHIVFTSGGSEGNNMVLKGVRHKLLQSGKTHLVISATEHDSVLRAAESLIKDGFYITYVKPNENGCITASIVENALQEDTGLVSVMFTNNETGAINDIFAIGDLCKQKSILFHSDCVQAAGQYEIDPNRNNIDFATVSSHKIHGPKGVGAVYIKNPTITPLIHGGSEQEYGLRGGTENVSGIVGFGKAADIAVDYMAESLIATSTLKQKFVVSLAKELPYENLKEARIQFNGYTYLDPGKVLNLRIDGVFGETLVLMLDAMGVCVSAGSACRSQEAAPSHALLAYGLSASEAKSSIRISFSTYNTEEEVERAAAIMAGCIETLRLVHGDQDGES